MSWSLITLTFVYPVKKWLTAESHANASNLRFLQSGIAEVMPWLLRHTPVAWCSPCPDWTSASGAWEQSERKPGRTTSPEQAIILQE